MAKTPIVRKAAGAVAAAVLAATAAAFPAWAAAGFPDDDVLEGAWYVPHVQAAADAGIVRGFPDGTFRPEQGVTRAQVAEMLCRAEGASLPEGAVAAENLTPWSDVEGGMWYTHAMNWACENGVFAGDGDGTTTVRPDAGISREEMAKAVASYMAKFRGADVDASGLGWPEGTTGLDELSGWAEPYFKWLAAEGVMGGHVAADGTSYLEAKGATTRAQFAKIAVAAAAWEPGRGPDAPGGGEGPVDPDVPEGPVDPALDPYDIGNGTFRIVPVADGFFYYYNGYELHGVDVDVYDQNGKNLCSESYTTGGGTEFHEQEFSSSYSFDRETGILTMAVEGVGKYHGTAVEKAPIPIYSEFYTGGLTCDYCGYSMVDADVLSYVCTDPSHSPDEIERGYAERGMYCSHLDGKRVKDVVVEASPSGSSSERRLVTPDEALKARAVCTYPYCSHYMKDITGHVRNSYISSLNFENHLFYSLTDPHWR